MQNTFYTIPKRVLLLSAMIAFVCALTAPASDKPNIVFIFADDLGFGDLACHGHPTIKTPHIDRLAQEGTDFWNFTVASPVCSPSRTGIVTGQFPSRWGVHQHFATHRENAARNMPDWLNPQAPLLPRVMKQAGYATAHYGKWHLSGQEKNSGAPLPAEYGYDYAAVWVGPGHDVFENSSFENISRKDGPMYQSLAATEHAVKFIRDAKGKPFYINLWLHESHHLVAASETEKQLYPGIAEPQRTYYAAVSRADQQVGRILEVLDELGIAKDTIVFFSSDNGPENSHLRPDQKFYFSQGSTGGLRGRKRSLLLGGINVPFLVRWPSQIPAGRIDKDTALSAVDVFPTLLEATKASPPDGYVSDGENMLPALMGVSQLRRKPLFWWWPGGHSGDDWPTFAMREGSWMLILDETMERAELYNVLTDRFQSQNLANEQPDRLAKMKSDIVNWYASLPKSIDAKMQTKTEIHEVQSSRLGASKNTGPSIDRERAFLRWDNNRDGFLTLEEYRNGLAKKDDAEKRFKNFDKDSDKKLTREEFISLDAK